MSKSVDVLEVAQNVKDYFDENLEYKFKVSLGSRDESFIEVELKPDKIEEKVKIYIVHYRGWTPSYNEFLGGNYPPLEIDTSMKLEVSSISFERFAHSNNWKSELIDKVDNIINNCSFHIDYNGEKNAKVKVEPKYISRV